MKKRLLSMAVVMGIGLTAMAQVTMDVNTKKLGAPIQSTMYGIFFEDINFAADGGLYGELVKNRSFEFPQHLMGWQAFGCVDVKDDGPFQRCPHYVELSDPGHRDRRTGLVNEGYFGIGVKKGEQYRFTVWAKAPKSRATIRIQLIQENSMDEGQDFANEHLEALHTIALENDGCFYVFYDKHQFVQGQAMPTWIDDMECRLVLNRNCRNTREIALTSTRPVGIAEEKVKMKLDVKTSDAIMVKPRMFILKGKSELLEALDARINQYVQAGIPREQIVILTMKTISTSLIDVGDYRLSGKNMLSTEQCDGKILFTTVRKFKGLEADVVICVDVDATTFETEKNRNAFYVGSSRAKLFLEVLSVLPTDADVVSTANYIVGGSARNRMRALGLIASGLKIKIETDFHKVL